MNETQLLKAAEWALELLPVLMDRLDDARGNTSESAERDEVTEVCDRLVAAIAQASK